MTVDLPFHDGHESRPTLTGARGRPCRHPRDRRTPAAGGWSCACGHVATAEVVRRGRSSKRRGRTGERRSATRYGWQDIGTRGQITDLRGRLMKVQQKTRRGAPPAAWVAIFRQLEAVHDGRVPAVLLSYVRQGVPADDYVVVRGSDWLDLFGRDELEETSFG